MYCYSVTCTATVSHVLLQCDMYCYSVTCTVTVPDQDECRFKVCKCDYDFAQCTKIYKSLYKGDCVRTKDTFICQYVISNLDMSVRNLKPIYVST